MLHLWYRPLAYRRVPSKMRPPQDRLRFGQTVFQPRASASDSEGKGGGDRDKNLSSGGGQLVQFFGRVLDRGVDLRYIV